MDAELGKELDLILQTDPSLLLFNRVDTMHLSVALESPRPENDVLRLKNELTTKTDFAGLMKALPTDTSFMTPWNLAAMDMKIAARYLVLTLEERDHLKSFIDTNLSRLSYLKECSIASAWTREDYECISELKLEGWSLLQCVRLIGYLGSVRFEANLAALALFKLKSEGLEIKFETEMIKDMTARVIRKRCKRVTQLKAKDEIKEKTVDLI